MNLIEGKTYIYTGGTKPANVEYCEKFGHFFLFRHLNSQSIFDLSEHEVSIFIK